MIEVAGHTDATGSEAKNFRLSRARADAVVQYLAVQHKIPLRRFVTPMGYGKTEQWLTTRPLPAVSRIDVSK